METTKNKLTPYAEHFFYKLGNYLDTKVYYYGSIQRNDYFPESSDIDVDIFTNNDSRTISQLQHLLGVEKYQFKKFVYKLNKTNKIVHGKKVQYEEKVNNFRTEISVYAEKDKEAVLLEHNAKSILPFYISYMLIFLKYLYYDLHVISKDIYKYFKRIIMNQLVEGQDVEFITTDITKKSDD